MNNRMVHNRHETNNIVACVHIKLMFDTHLHPAQPVPVPMPCRDTSSTVTNSHNIQDSDVHALHTQQALEKFPKTKARQARTIPRQPGGHQPTLGRRQVSKSTNKRQGFQTSQYATRFRSQPMNDRQPLNSTK